MRKTFSIQKTNNHSNCLFRNRLNFAEHIIQLLIGFEDNSSLFDPRTDVLPEAAG